MLYAPAEIPSFAQNLPIKIRGVCEDVGVLKPEQYLSSIERDAAAFAIALQAGVLDLEIAACPGWTLEQLGRHLGGVHRWAAAILESRVSGQVPEGPADGDKLATWFIDGADELLAALRSSDPAAATWTFGPHPQRTSFWFRRQAHETAMHLFDAHRAMGIGTEFDVDLAADGIDEVCTILFPRQVRLGRTRALQQGVSLVLLDGPETKHVIAGDGNDPDADADAIVFGSAQRLLLALWGRGGIEGLDVQGDPDVVRRILGSGLTA